MRVVVTSVVIATFFGATSARAQRLPTVEPSRVPIESAPAKHAADVAALFRYEATGLSLLRPYQRGRIPVVFIHGLWSSPLSWSTMVDDLEAEAELTDPDHIEDSVAAAELSLSEADLEQIDRIMAGSVAMTGPHPEMMPE